MGRARLLELRCRFLDRFGDLDKLPLLRFLYIDTDAEAVKAAMRGSPEVALQPHEVYHLPLQPVAHYRRRQLDQLDDWLPREKLYALPRSLQDRRAREPWAGSPSPTTTCGCWPGSAARCSRPPTPTHSTRP